MVGDIVDYFCSEHTVGGGKGEGEGGWKGRRGGGKLAIAFSMEHDRILITREERKRKREDRKKTRINH